MGRIPMEIMSYIFEFYFSDSNYSSFHYVDSGVSSHHSKIYYEGALPLGAVCRAWRYIAWTTPYLWTTLWFDFNTKTTLTNIQLAVEWLGRSGRLPLNIHLHMNSKEGKTAIRTQIYALPLIDAFNRCTSRCWSPHLEMPSSLLHRFSRIEDRCITKTLILACDDMVDVLDLEPLVAPTTLEIYGVDLLSFDINWANLTTFRATCLHIDEILAALAIAPQLTACEHESINSRDPILDFADCASIFILS